jgi:uncharacterized protein YecE (DUF72 family)
MSAVSANPLVSTILVGTASWADTSLTRCGRFYPPEARTAEARLRFYAEHFRLVEVDSSYYAVPASHTAEQWCARTPADFVFNVKAFRLFTGHHAQPEVLPADLRTALGAPEHENLYYRDLPADIARELWRRFRLALEPLRHAGKLGCVLLQFAPWLTANREALAHILHCKEMLDGFPVALEFRNESWFSGKARDRVLAFEREHGFTHVVVDEPQGFTNSIPQVWEVTQPDLAIVRLHGRNRDTWTRKGLASSAERFNYLYSSAELTGLAERVKALAKQARALHVLFNNCHEDKAQRNALQFAELVAPVLGAKE